MRPPRLKIILLVLLFELIAACGERILRTPRAEAQLLPLVDVHSHYSPKATAEEWLAMMDSAGIKRMILFGRRPQGIEMVRQHPDRFLAFYEGAIGDDSFRAKMKGGHDPALVAQVAADLEQAIRSGLYQGFGEIHTYHDSLPSQIAPDSPMILRVLELAGRYGVPVSIHSTAGGRSEMERALRANPKTMVIWAHTGIFLSPAAVEELLSKYPNLYFDLAIKDRGLRKPRDIYPISVGTTIQDNWRLLFESHPGRFFLGSDFSLGSPYHNWPLSMAPSITGYFRTVLMQLTPATAKKIAYENAEQLFSFTKN